MLDKQPYFNVQDAKIIANDLFSLSGAFSELPSERDQNFLLVTETNEKFVLKIANQYEKLNNLLLQNKIINHIASYSVYNHPKLIKIKDQELLKYRKDSDEYFVRLLTYIEGFPYAHVIPSSEEYLLEFGKFLGNLTKSMNNFRDFDQEFKDKEFYWDLKYSDSTIAKHKTLVKETKKLQVINYFQNMFLSIKHIFDSLPQSIIHNDANDYNVIVSFDDFKIKFGIIDFGDMVYSHTIINLAVGIAYAVLQKADPVMIITTIVKGYNEIIQLQEEEIKILFSLIAIRLTLSVCISAYQQTLEPDNSYLVISEKPAWLTLIQLKNINPTWIELILRNTVGIDPYPFAEEIKVWLKENSKIFNPLIVNTTSEIELIDLSISSPLGTFNELIDIEKRLALIKNKFISANKKVAICYYNNARIDYLNINKLFQSTDMILFKNYVKGIDIYSIEDLPIFLQFDGILFKILINSDYMYTIIFEHETALGQKFYSVFVNIDIRDLQATESGSYVVKGTNVGFVKNISNNSFPFRYQLFCTDQIDLFQESYLSRDKYIVDKIFYDPLLLISSNLTSSVEFNEAISNLEEERMKFVGPSLSISYKNHLHIVRGFMQFLYNDKGQIYLDAVNNVPHVGHNNPNVVSVLINQAKVLNTNTRYLHETIIKFAKKISSLLPEKLHVCYFVNSGSEANELALRLAETYTNKKGIAVLNHAYHGNTSKLIDISPYKHNGPGGKGTPAYVHILDLPDPYRGKYKGNNSETGQKYANEAIEEIKQFSDIGTFIFESFPGVAGQIVLAEGYVKQLCSFLHEKGVIVIADEVQIGLGRVGSNFWGFQEHDIIPDIVTIGKPLGNGHPLGAVITTENIANAFNNGMEYFNTFGGNPVSCAVGLAVLKEIEQGHLQQNASDVGTLLLKNLLRLKKRYPLIGNVRGKGLYIGIELVRNQIDLEPADWEASYVVERMKDKGVLVSTDGPYHNVIKIKPPLVFTKDNALELVNKLEKVLQESVIYRNSL